MQSKTQVEVGDQRYARDTVHRMPTAPTLTAEDRVQRETMGENMGEH